MRQIKFRAWDGRKIRNNFAINSKGVAMLNPALTKEVEHCPDWILEQFTGLLDKNGREIYEGDILASKMGRSSLTGVMAWNSSDGAWDRFRPHSSWEVIGNIHENPELLGGAA